MARQRKGRGGVTLGDPQVDPGSAQSGSPRDDKQGRISEPVAPLAPTLLEREADSVEMMSEDEAAARYYGEWIFMIVNSEDARGVGHGQVVAHSPSRDEVQAKFLEVWPLLKLAAGQYTTIFDGYPRARTGEEARAAIAEALEYEHDPTGLDRW